MIGGVTFRNKVFQEFMTILLLSDTFGTREWIITEPYTSIQQKTHISIHDRLTGVGTVIHLQPGDTFLDSVSIGKILVGSMLKCMEDVAQVEKYPNLKPLDPKHVIIKAEHRLTRYKETVDIGEYKGKIHILEWFKRGEK